MRCLEFSEALIIIIWFSFSSSSNKQFLFLRGEFNSFISFWIKEVSLSAPIGLSTETPSGLAQVGHVTEGWEMSLEVHVVN